MELMHQWVRFRISDVYLPDPQTLLLELFGESVLRGRVRDLTESGSHRFAVVDVEGIERPVIILVGRFLGAS